MENCPKRPPIAVTIVGILLAAIGGAYVGRKIAYSGVWVSGADADNIKISTAGGTWNYNHVTGKLTKILSV